MYEISFFFTLDKKKQQKQLTFGQSRSTTESSELFAANKSWESH